MAPEKPIGENDLTAYMDRELPEARRQVVREWLQEHPEARHRVEADMALQQRLIDGLAPIRDEVLPDGFGTEAIADTLRARRLTRVTRLAAVLVLVSLGTGGGWLARGIFAPPHVSGSSALALAAHQTFVVDAARPVEIAAEASDQLGNWLGNRIGLTVSVPDLSDIGLKLIGGRLLPGEDGVPAGQLMYENMMGQRVTLYLRASRGDGDKITFKEVGNDHMLSWKFEEMAYTLTGPGGQDEMQMIAAKVNAAAS